MQRNVLNENQKTVMLLGSMNFIGGILNGIAFGMRAGLGCLIAENLFALYMLHEHGKSKRIVSNAGTGVVSYVGSFFKSSQPSPDNKVIQEIEANEVNNAIKNITTGGAAIFDACESFAKVNSRPGRQ